MYVSRISKIRPWMIILLLNIKSVLHSPQCALLRPLNYKTQKIKLTGILFVIIHKHKLEDDGVGKWSPSL